MPFVLKLKLWNVFNLKTAQVVRVLVVEAVTKKCLLSVK